LIDKEGIEREGIPNGIEDRPRRLTSESNEDEKANRDSRVMEVIADIVSGAFDLEDSDDDSIATVDSQDLDGGYIIGAISSADLEAVVLPGFITESEDRDFKVLKGGVRPNSGSELAEFLGLEAGAISSWNPRGIMSVTGICMKGCG
jgi:hypothetical protein